MDLHVENIRKIGSLDVSIGLGDMTGAKADAYVVPQFPRGVSSGGVAGAIIAAGAQIGCVDEYLAILKKAGGETEPGSAFVVRTYGGKSSHLVHVVSAGIDEYEQAGVVGTSVFNALEAARDAALKSVVFPVLGTGVIGTLTDEESAKAMFSAADRFARLHPETSIETTFVAYGHPSQTHNTTFLTLKQVLTTGAYLDTATDVAPDETSSPRFG